MGEEQGPSHIAHRFATSPVFGIAEGIRCRDGFGCPRRSVGFCHEPGTCRQAEFPERDRDNISADLRGVLLKRPSVNGRPLEKCSGSSQGGRVGGLKSGDMLKRQAGRPASP